MFIGKVFFMQTFIRLYIISSQKRRRRSSNLLS